MSTAGRRLPVAVIAPARGCDCSVCAFFIGNPDAREPMCSGTNTSCSYCGCARSEAPGPSPCGQCPIRCGSRTDIRAWMADVGGTLSFDDVVLETLLPPALPRFIPQVDGHDVAGFDAQLRWPAYGLGLRRVFSPDTHRVYPRFPDTTAHEALGLRPDQLAVLVATAKTPWWKRSGPTAGGDRATWSPSAGTWCWPPTTRMYGNQPRAEHLLDFRRNLLIADEMADAGIAAVPNVYWFRKEDLDRYLSWVDDAAAGGIATNLQTFRTEEDWELMALPGLTYLAMGLAHGVADDRHRVLAGRPHRHPRRAVRRPLAPGLAEPRCSTPVTGPR